MRKTINRTVSAIVLTAFLLNTAVSDLVFGQTIQSRTNNDMLSTPLAFDDIAPTLAEQDMRRINTVLTANLAAGIGMPEQESVKVLKPVQPKDVQVFFNERHSLGSGRFSVMCRRWDQFSKDPRTYYAICSSLPEDRDNPVLGIYTKREWQAALGDQAKLFSGPHIRGEEAPAVLKFRKPKAPSYQKLQVHAAAARKRASASTARASQGGADVPAPDSAGPAAPFKQSYRHPVLIDGINLLQYRGPDGKQVWVNLWNNARGRMARWHFKIEYASFAAYAEDEKPSVKRIDMPEAAQRVIDCIKSIVRQEAPDTILETSVTRTGIAITKQFNPDLQIAEISFGSDGRYITVKNARTGETTEFDMAAPAGKKVSLTARASQGGADGEGQAPATMQMNPYWQTVEEDIKWAIEQDKAVRIKPDGTVLSVKTGMPISAPIKARLSHLDKAREELDFYSSSLQTKRISDGHLSLSSLPKEIIDWLDGISERIFGKSALFVFDENQEAAEILRMKLLDLIDKAKNADIFVVLENTCVSPRTNALVHVRRGVRQSDNGIWIGENFLSELLWNGSDEGHRYFAQILFDEAMHIGNKNPHGTVQTLEDLDRVVEHTKVMDTETAKIAFSRAQDRDRILYRIEKGKTAKKNLPWEPMLAGNNVGKSDKMKKLFDQLRVFAEDRSANTLLIHSPTGSGKNMAVAAIAEYMEMPRDKQHIKHFSCASLSAMSPDNMHADLFGRVLANGEYSPGIIDEHTNLLIIDELPDASDALQGKLLELLDERRSVRLPNGDRLDLKDMKIVCLANRAFNLRTDLRSRISKTLKIPHLNERGDDIVLLAEYFNYMASIENGMPWAPLDSFMGGVIKDMERVFIDGTVGQIRDVKHLMENIVANRKILLAGSDLSRETAEGREWRARELFSPAVITVADLYYTDDDVAERVVLKLHARIGEAMERDRRAKAAALITTSCTNHIRNEYADKPLLPYFPELAARNAKGEPVGFYRGPFPAEQPGMAQHPAPAGTRDSASGRATEAEVNTRLPTYTEQLREHVIRVLQDRTPRLNADDEAALAAELTHVITGDMKLTESNKLTNRVTSNPHQFFSGQLEEAKGAEESASRDERVARLERLVKCFVPSIRESPGGASEQVVAKPWEPMLPGGNVGKSNAMLELFDQLRQFATNKSSDVMLISGSTGLGKNMAANAVAEMMGANEDKVKKFSCARFDGISINEMDARLFGRMLPDGRYQPGLITKETKLLIIDEFPNASRELQGRLLSLMDDNKSILLPDNTELDLKSIKIVCLANWNIEHLRHDLRRRINMHVQMPRLTERGDDILLLAELFNYEASRENGIAWGPIDNCVRDIIKKVSTKYWVFESGHDSLPKGNIRDVKHLMERIVINRAILMKMAKLPHKTTFGSDWHYRDIFTPAAITYADIEYDNNVTEDNIVYRVEQAFHTHFIKGGTLRNTWAAIDAYYDRGEGRASQSGAAAENAKISTELAEMEALANEVGARIPVKADKRYTLLVMDEFFANGERKEHQDAFADRFNLDTISGATTGQFVKNILNNPLCVKDRTIALVRDDLSDTQLEELARAGVRFIRMSKSDLIKARSDKGQESRKYRKQFQIDTYAMMLLARQIETTDPSSPLYRLLSFYIRTHFNLPETVTVDDYMNAIVNSNVVNLLKGILSYRPVKAYNRPDYRNVAATLISA